MKSKNKVKKAIKFIIENCYVDLPSECKDWQIDQVLQILTGCTETHLSDEYMELVDDAEIDGYRWNQGRKPTQREFEDASIPYHSLDQENECFDYCEERYI
jgi:hypothetical protein